MMSTFKCKMCGGTLEIIEGATTAECTYCGSMQTLPKLDNERKANLYDRANHFRRNNDYDKARAIYESILNEDSTDAESYWSIILCEYGIEYVEDPATHKRIPTVNRAQFTSVLSDENYKKAIEHADINQKIIYEKEAAAIDEIQKGILSISQKEEPFDVFICYKETDAAGRRTPDSVLANDLYHQLTQEGFKVFFSRITLENKLGSAYEPYIFAALNSAKAMVVIGTRPEHFSAVWVKNEWSRFLNIVKKSGGKKVLIPAYKDMDPYDLPEEFSHLQAQDMSKLGFMQDLLRGIKKIVKSAETPVKTVPMQAAEQGNTKNLLKRAKIFLEDKDWEAADEYCEKILDLDPENCQAYIYKLMADAMCSTPEEMKTCSLKIEKGVLFDRIIKYANDAIKAKMLEIADYNNKYREYRKAKAAYETEDINHISKGIEIFEEIKDFEDSSILIEKSKEKINEIKYSEAKAAYETEDINRISEGIAIFEGIKDFRDSRILMEKSNQKINEIKYREAECYANEGTIESLNRAISLFNEIGGWKDSDDKAKFCKERIEAIPLDSKYLEAESRAKENNIESLNKAISLFNEISGWKDSDERAELCKKRIRVITDEKKAKRRAIKKKLLIVAICAVIIAGIAVAVTQIIKFKSINELKIVREEIDENHIRGTVSAGKYHTVGLKEDGTVVAVGDNDYGQCDVEGWRDMVAVSAGADIGEDHTVGLREDGTVVAVGNNNYGQCDVEGWRDIVAISAGCDHTVGLREDGTVVATGDNYDGQCRVEHLENIVAVSAGWDHTVGLREDGTVVALGSNYAGKRDVEDWRDIVAISAGDSHTVGLKKDGTVVAVGYNYDSICLDYNYDGVCNVEGWRDIVAISAGGKHTVGLKADGTVVATGYNNLGQCDVKGWRDIIAISAGGNHTVGLKKDGTVVATGHNTKGQCDVKGWKNIRTSK